MGVSKKQKRYSPYDMRHLAFTDLDESQFMDAPVLEAKEANQRAWVAGPQQPPPHK